MYTLSTINVTGADAFEFLQGQLTNDLGRLQTEAEILAAWCNPKGRVIWFGTIRNIESGFALSAPADTAEDIVKHFKPQVGDKADAPKTRGVTFGASGFGDKDEVNIPIAI